MLINPSELLSFVFNPVFDIATDTRTSAPLLAFYLSIAWSVSLKNIATGETSQAITPFHFFDNFNFHH